MNIKKFIAAVVLGFLAGAGCTQKEGVPVEFSKACSPENEKKYVQISGFLDIGGSTFCSNIGGGRMECRVKFIETPKADKGFSAQVEQGSGANTMDKLGRSFKVADVKIRDNNGKIINLGEKVKLTGEMNVTPDGSVCFLKVMKIER